ncbi:hypothetical protein D3C87_1665320 [compost metagenome]
MSISSGIARLDTSRTTAQPVNNERRDTRSASAPIGNCSKASPTTTVLTIAKAISVVKPWRRQYTGNSVRIIASNAANSDTAQAIAGRPRQNVSRSPKVTLQASLLGAPLRPSNRNGAATSKPTPTQKP